MNTAISTALSPYSTTSQMNSAISSALAPYATTSALTSGLATKAPTFSVSGGSLTYSGNVIGLDLSPYATVASLNTKQNTIDWNNAPLVATAGSLYVKGFELYLGNGDQTTRGNTSTSRALVKMPGGELYLNYGADFSKVRIDSGCLVNGGLEVLGGIALSNASSNLISFNTAGGSPPTFGSSRSPGTKLVLYPQQSSTSVDYGLGIMDSSLWYSVPASFAFHRWYHGDVNTMTLSTTTLTVAGATMASQPWVSSNFSKIAGVVLPITYSGNILGFDQSKITNVGTLGQTEIRAEGNLWTTGDPGTNNMTALKLKQSFGASYGVCLSLDATPGPGGKNWALFSTSGNAGQGTGHLLLTQNGTDRAWFRNDGSFLLANGADPSIYLTPGNTSVAPQSIGLFMHCDRAAGPACSLQSVNAGNNDAYLSVKVATGSGNVTAAETIRSTTATTTIMNQLVVNNTTPISHVMTAMQNSSGGSLRCEGPALFHHQVVISGKTSMYWNGGYRYFAYGGTGLADAGSGSGNYSLMIGQGGRVLMASGSELNAYSDSRNKLKIRTYEEEEALQTVRNVRATKFAYVNQPDRTRYGWIAQELLKDVPDLISVVSNNESEEDDRFVLNEQGMSVVTYAALRGLIKQVDELKSEVEALRK